MDVKGKTKINEDPVISRKIFPEYTLSQWTPIRLMAGIVKRHHLLNTILLASFLGSQLACTTVYYVDTYSEDSATPEDHRSGYTRFDEDPEPAGSYTLNDGQLIIKAKERQDLWGSYKRGAPLLLRSAPSSNYEIETFVVATAYGASTPNPAQPSDTQVGLFVYQDFCNWIFFGLTNHPSYPDLTSLDGAIVPTDGLILTVAEDPESSSGECASFRIVDSISFGDDAVYLKIKRNGDSWWFYSRSHPDQAWRLLTSLGDFHLGEHKVGMGVKTFEDTLPSKAQGMFDYFIIRKKVSIFRSEE